MQTPTYLNTLRLHSEKLDQLVDKLDQMFSQKPIVPSDSIEQIMYRAGQASVIEYIKQIQEDEN